MRAISRRHRALLDKISGALPAFPGATPTGATHPGAGLAMRGHPQESAWRQDEKLWAAIVGYPRWSDPELASLARGEGHAAALMEAYKRFGTKLLERLFGHFVFAILEPDRGRAFCAIDRFGGLPALLRDAPVRRFRVLNIG